jgi:hypothetical protein
MITKGEGKDKKNRDRRSEPQRSAKERPEWWKDGRMEEPEGRDQSLRALEPRSLRTTELKDHRVIKR